jgi:hypothetical protein
MKATTATKDALVDNLIGMCAYQGRSQEFPCGQTVRTRAEYCTSCEAAERLKPISAFALRDALRLLARLVGPCEGGTSDHAWRKCRRCLTLHEIQTHQEPALRLLRVVLAQFGDEA